MGRSPVVVVGVGPALAAGQVDEGDLAQGVPVRLALALERKLQGEGVTYKGFTMDARVRSGACFRHVPCWYTAPSVHGMTWGAIDTVSLESTPA